MNTKKMHSIFRHARKHIKLTDASKAGSIYAGGRPYLSSLTDCYRHLQRCLVQCSNREFTWLAASTGRNSYAASYGVGVVRRVLCGEVVCCISKTLTYCPCVTRDHTVLSANHTQTIPAFTPQLQCVTALWLVLIALTNEGMARLS